MPLTLLCIGANIRLNNMGNSMEPSLVSMMGKMLLFPGMIFLFSQWVQLTGTAASVALLFGMGGDASLVASMINLQTMFSFLTLPLTVTLPS